MSSFDHTHFYTYSKDKTLLHGMFWLPKTDVKAMICLVHGLGGHIARFSDLAIKLCENNIGLVGVDLRGHGNSYGKRGYVKSLQNLYDDVSASLKYAFQFIAKDTPIYIYGNSMGGPVALNYAINHTDVFKGIILTAPWFTLYHQPKENTVSILKVINKAFPGFTLTSNVKSKDFRSNPQMQEEARVDLLVHKKISVRLLYMIYELGLELISKEIKGFNLPTIIFHGESDRVTDYKSTIQYYMNNKKHTTYISLPDTRHEIHVEPESENVLRKIVSWINENQMKGITNDHIKKMASIE